MNFFHLVAFLCLLDTDISRDFFFPATVCNTSSKLWMNFKAYQKTWIKVGPFSKHSLRKGPIV